MATSAPFGTSPRTAASLERKEYVTILALWDLGSPVTTYVCLYSYQLQSGDSDPVLESC